MALRCIFGVYADDILSAVGNSRSTGGEHTSRYCGCICGRGHKKDFILCPACNAYCGAYCIAVLGGNVYAVRADTESII